MKPEVKALLESHTFWGAIVSIVSSLLALGHYSISTADQDYLINLALSIVAVSGSVYAIYGRVIASKKIGSVLPK